MLLEENAVLLYLCSDDTVEPLYNKDASLYESIRLIPEKYL